MEQVSQHNITFWQQNIGHLLPLEIWWQPFEFVDSSSRELNVDKIPYDRLSDRKYEDRCTKSNKSFINWKTLQKTHIHKKVKQ